MGATLVLVPPVARTGPLGFLVEVAAATKTIAVVLEAVAVAIAVTEVPVVATETLEALATIVANFDNQVSVLETCGSGGACACRRGQGDCTSDGCCDCDCLRVHFFVPFSFVLSRGWCGVVEERYEGVLYRSDF